ncbi:GWxTD domain-containing protein [bacterium]|nr:GWxTD domain-containing protein [bacterium]
MKLQIYPLKHICLISLYITCCLMSPLFAQSKKIICEKENTDQRAQIIRLINQDQFAVAESMIQLLNTQKPHAWNHLHLGRIYAAQKNWSKAELHFKAAKGMKPGYAEAYFELGKLYMDGPYLMKEAYMEFHWGLKHNKDWLDGYYYKSSITSSLKNYVTGISELKPMILKNPNHRNGYQIYVKTGLAFHAYNTLCDFLPEVIRSFPNSNQYKLDYINALYMNGNSKSANEYLNLYRTALIQTKPAQWHLQKAKVSLALNKDHVAWESYNTGLKHIKNSKEADLYFKDMQFIITDQEWNNYMHADIAGKINTLHIAWKSRDPTLTTTFNERFTEHYKRLRYAFKNFRRWGDMQPTENILADFMPTKFNDSLLLQNLGQSKGITNQMHINDAGIIYIRHGSPDKTYTRVGDIYRMNMSWQYAANHGRPDMSFHFFIPTREAVLINTQFKYNKTFTPMDFTATLKPQKTLLGWIIRLAPKYGGSAGDWINAVSPQDVIRSIKTASSTETTNFAPDIPLNFNWDLYLFQNPDLSGQLLFCYELPKDISPGNLPAGSSLDQKLVIFNNVWSIVDTAEHHDNTETIGSNLLRKLIVSVPSGHHFAGFCIKNKANGGEGHVKFQIESKFSSLLDISSIVMANLDSNMKALKETDQHHSLADIIVPNLKQQFKQGESIVLYFEIYRLIRDSEGKTNATITFSIEQSRTKKGLFSKVLNKKDELIKVSVDHQIQSGQENEYILQSIMLPKYEPGFYQLNIMVQDHNSLLRTQKKTQFTITDEKQDQIAL